MKLGLKAKIIVPIIVLNIVVFLTQIFTFRDSMKKALTAEFVSKGSALAKGLSSSVQDTLLNRDASTIQGFIDQYRNIKGVEYIYILNDKKEIVAHTFHPSVPQKFKIASKSAKLNSKFMTREIEVKGQRVIDIQAPILAGLLGRVYFGMGIEKVEREVLWPLVMKSLVLRGILALIGIGITIYLLHSLIHPIVELTRATNNIVKDKKLDVAIKVTSMDEVGELSTSFNTMMAELNRHTQDLENLIQERSEKINEQQMQLVESARLSSLGEMAGGIAHEINNPLAIISGNNQVIRRMIEKDKVNLETMMTLLERNASTIDRIKKIINGLRGVSRDASRETFTTITIRTFVEDSVGLCQERLKSLGIDFSIDEDNPLYDQEVSCLQVQLSQVLLNLLNNACDEVVDQENGYIRISLSKDQDFFYLRVEDSGNGIPMEIQEKIFRPFFTTKEVGKGTGLGLSLSHKIISNHGGQLRIDNECNNTCFIIQLPCPSHHKQEIAV